MVQVYKVGDDKTCHFQSYADELREFISAHNDAMNKPVTYAGIVMKHSAINTLVLIERFPGITVSELAEKENRTMGTISTMVSQLEKAGLIKREKREGNAKLVHLYATAEGEKIATQSAGKVAKNAKKMQEKLLEDCSASELNTFCKVLHNLMGILSEDTDLI